MTTGLWDRQTFVEKLHAIGARAYHDKHPFHVAMNEGRLAPEALRGWVVNRFYYQRNIPVKDAAFSPTVRCAMCAESGFIAHRAPDSWRECCVFDRNISLVIETIDDPAAQCFRREPAFIHGDVERMFIVVSPRTDRM